MDKIVKMPQFRVGTGYDVHKLVPERKLILCGVEVPYELGLLGHSDADVASMAIYQGAITFAAGLIEPYMTDAMISDMGYIGSTLIFAIGINLAFGKKIKTGNMLPAILIPVIYNLIFVK